MTKFNFKNFSILGLLVLSFIGLVIFAGVLEPTSSPDPTMHSLEEIYSLITGDPPPSPGLSPTAEIGSSMHTISDVYIALANLIQHTDLAPTSPMYLGVGTTTTPTPIATSTKEFNPTSNAGDIVGFTLEDIYNLITNNNRITTASHNFAPDSETPSETQYSLDDIYTALTGLIQPENINDGVIYLGVTGNYVDGFCGGSGTVEDPFQICSWTSLNNIQNHLDVNYILTTDLSSESEDYVGLGDDWQPIGTLWEPFLGKFDGGNNTIADLYINQPGENGVGLFGVLGDYNDPLSSVSSIAISNVNLIVQDVVGADYNAGGLVGISFGSTITNCSVIVSGSISGNNTTGGFMGQNNSSIISNSFVVINGNISSDEYSGGFTGYNWAGQITDSYVVLNGNINAPSVGGFVGLNRTLIENSYLIIDSEATLTGETRGAFISYQEEAMGQVISSYWDQELSSISEMCGYFVEGFEGGCDNTNGKTTAEMKQQATFVGWDFATVWSINEGSDYPHLQWEN